MRKVLKALLSGILALVIGLLIMVVIPSFTIGNVLGLGAGTAVGSYIAYLIGGDAT